MSDLDSLNQINQLLDSPTCEYRQLVGRAKLLGKVNTAFSKLLPKSSQKHLIIMNFTADSVTIGADSAARLTRFRYDAQNLLLLVKQIPGLEGTTHLHFKVQPTAVNANKNPVRRATLSEQSQEVLRRSAEGFADPALRSALLRLSRNRASTS